MRKLDQLGIGNEQVAVTLVNRDAFHNICAANYEADLADVRVPLDKVLEPIGVERVEADVLDCDFSKQTVQVRSPTGQSQSLNYDRLVFALGVNCCGPTSPA